MSLTESTPLEVASAASTASRQLATLQCEARNEALTLIHEELQKDKDSILAANAKDLELAIQAAENGELSQSVLKRLDLGRKGKWDDMLQGILDVRDLEDPDSPAEVLYFSGLFGKITLRTRLDEGLELERVTCPIGVLLIIFEARPEVIANIASLAIKSGNAAILKGGKETTLSFLAISTTISTALSRSRVPNTAIQLVATRDAISSLLDLDNHIDLVIPRGSNDLVRYIKHHTRIPVLGHADGLCSIYIHEDADPDMAVKVILDAKLDYPAACNAVETLLIDESALPTLLPPVATALLENGVSLRCDAPSKTALTTHLPPHLSTFLQPSTPADYTTEFLSPTLALLTLPTPSPPSPTTACNNAITHINTHSSHHTDAILTSSATTARQFQQGIDSACVFWNTSTRMADGMRFGFGTEVGISTNKVHARGPVGLEGLCVYKYLVGGRGQVAGEYGGEGGKRFLHEKLALDG